MAHNVPANHKQELTLHEHENNKLHDQQPWKGNKHTSVWLRVKGTVRLIFVGPYKQHWQAWHEPTLRIISPVSNQVLSASPLRKILLGVIYLAKPHHDLHITHKCGRNNNLSSLQKSRCFTDVQEKLERLRRPINYL